MEKNMIYSYRKYEMSYQEYANMLRKYILDKIKSVEEDIS